MIILCVRRNNVLLFVVVVLIITILYMTSREEKPAPVIVGNIATKYHLQPPQLKLNPEYIINSFIIQPSSTLCENNFSPKIIWIITSHVANNDVRIKQRYTLKTEDLEYFNTTRLFLVGRIPPGEERRITQIELVDESIAYGDILQGNFTEDHKNLTHKHLMGLHWITTYCNDATFLIKTDDNYDFSMRRLNLILQNLHQRNVDKDTFMMGFIQEVPLKYREDLSNWYKKKGNTPLQTVSHYIPPYLPGWLYLTTPKVAERLTRHAVSLPYFWKDDVFVTGVIASELQIRLLELNQFH